MSPFELYGLVLSGSVVAVALVLLGWHRAERRREGWTASDADLAHFARQDRLRRVVAAVMIVLAGLILVGSRTPHQIGRRPNPLFIIVWLTTFALVLALLVLAFLDWVSIRRYARRQRGAIVRESLDLLKDELRRHAAPPTNGRSHDGTPDGLEG